MNTFVSPFTVLWTHLNTTFVSYGLTASAAAYTSVVVIIVWAAILFAFFYTLQKIYYWIKGSKRSDDVIYILA